MTSKPHDACTEERFLKDVAAHEMTIIRDDGVHRHVRFKKPGTYCMHFDLLTWPGYLCYTGDMGTYVFRRLEDMFEFFRTDRGWLRDGKTLGINPSYWAEKLEATDRNDGHEEFDADRFRQVINQYRVRWMRDMRERGSDKDARRELWDAVERDVMGYADHNDEGAARASAYNFSHGDFQFEDIYEYSMRRYTFRFMWCCYALAWGIQQYDNAKKESAVTTDMELLREYVRRDYSYHGVEDPVSVVAFRQVEKDGDSHPEARVGDWWITENRTDGYGELVRIENGAVRQIHYEGA